MLKNISKTAAILLILLLTLFYFAGCTPKSGVKANGESYILDIFSGDVTISHNDGKDWVKPEPGMALRESDMIKTGPDSFCDIIMPARGIFRVADGSIVVLKDLKKKVEQIDVRKGKIIVNVTQKLNPDESFEVETSAAVAAVRGTEFIIETDGNKTKTSVKKGQVMVKKNIDLKVSDKVNKAELEPLLSVPVSEKEAVEMDAAENQKTAADLNKKLEGVTDTEKAKSIVQKEHDAALKTVKKAEGLDKDFDQLNTPENLKKLQEETEKYQKDIEVNKAALETNVENIQKKTGQMGIAKQKVGEEATTAEQDIKSGVVDKKMEDIKKRAGNSGIANKKVDTESDQQSDEDTLSDIKSKMKNKLKKK